MHFDINTAPLDEAIPYVLNCLDNAIEAGNEYACATFRHLLWALETELETGIFPKAELNARINTLNQ